MANGQTSARDALRAGLRLVLAFGVSQTVACGGEAAPAERRATPATLDAMLAVARGGEHIRLSAGNYGDVTLPPRKYRQTVTIDASRATFTGLMIRGIDGIAIAGGTVLGDRDRNIAVTVDFSRHVALTGLRVSGSRVGIGVARSQDIVLADNRLDGLRSDGINFAGVQRVRITGNVCANFDPIPAVYDAAGKLVTDGDHPDCIQGWSIAGRPPTADVTIERNSGVGFMQGIFSYLLHQGGLDRIIVRDNHFELNAFNGIALGEARDSVVTGNVVHTLPGARMRNYPFRPVTAWIRVTGERNRVCGNTVDNPRFSDGAEPC